MQYHEVRINIDFARLQDLIITSVPVASGSTTYTAATAGQVSVSGGSIGYASLYVDYIYLNNRVEKRQGCTLASTNPLVVYQKPQSLVISQEEDMATPSNCWNPLKPPLPNRAGDGAMAQKTLRYGDNAMDTWAISSQAFLHKKKVQRLEDGGFFSKKNLR